VTIINTGIFIMGQQLISYQQFYFSLQNSFDL